MSKPSEPRTNTCAIVLAGGKSQRMGRQKLLLPLGGRPMIAVVVDEVLRSPCDQTFVVVGEDGARIQQALEGRPVTFVGNRGEREDMLTSVRCGLQALPDTCDSILIVLGDQPGIQRSLITQMLASYAGTGCRIVVPAYQGRRGHPLLFSARYRQEVMTEFDETGLRGLLYKHPEQVFELPCESPAMLGDIDTPEQYERRRSEFE